MKCLLSPRALRQLDDIHDYIAERDPLAADALVDRIHSLMRILEGQPYIGRPTGRPNVRMHALVRFPYLVVYRVKPDRNEIKILRVMHAARRHPGFQESAEQFAR